MTPIPLRPVGVASAIIVLTIKRATDKIYVLLWQVIVRHLLLIYAETGVSSTAYTLAAWRTVSPRRSSQALVAFTALCAKHYC